MVEQTPGIAFKVEVVYPFDQIDELGRERLDPGVGSGDRPGNGSNRICIAPQVRGQGNGLHRISFAVCCQCQTRRHSLGHRDSRTDQVIEVFENLLLALPFPHDIERELGTPVD